jgi:mRNA export factor
MSGFYSNQASTTPSQGDISKDVAVKEPPPDSISQIAFSPVADYLAVSSWDNKVRIYEIDGNGNSQGKAYIDFQAPALSVAWSPVSSSKSCCFDSLSSSNGLSTD